VRATDRPGLLRDLASLVADDGGNIVGVRHIDGAETEMHLDVSGVRDADALLGRMSCVPGVLSSEMGETAGRVFGKRVIVIGGGAQVAQVVLGAVSEADRHNIRGERISVDTIPLVGEARLAEGVRAVARLHRAAILVLAGSLMGGEITIAVRELREKYGIPVISLNMAGSVPDEADLVVSDPVQAGTMAVMAIADTASFSLERVRGKRF
jgi:energy-converting hydrogenase B subunit Q